MDHFVKLEVTITCMVTLLSPLIIISASALVPIQQTGSSITITHLVQLSRFVVVMGTWTSNTIPCHPFVHPIGSAVNPCSLLTTAYGGKVVVEWGDGTTINSKIVPNNSQASQGNWMPAEHFYYIQSNVKPYSTHYTIIVKLIGPNNELLALTSQDVIV